MKATKYTVTVTMEMLSLDVLPSLFGEAFDLLEQEANEAFLSHDDGDSVAITIEREAVEI